MIWIDTQGSLTHIVEIFKFGNVSGNRGTKWPKLNRLLKIVNYFTCMWHTYPRICNPYCWDIQIRKCLQMAQTKSTIKNSKLFCMYVDSRDPQKLIWIDTQGDLTHIVEIFKFGDVSAPRAKRWPKVNRLLKIVNYFTCMRYFSCKWYGPPELDFGDVSGPGGKMNRWLKIDTRSWFELIPKDL